MFTFVISCLTTSNLPWFMDLTFQFPMQYCTLEHWTLLLSPGLSTTGCFCYGSIPSFYLELFLHWSPIAYWAPTDLGSSSFSVLSFCLCMLFMGHAVRIQGQNTEVVCHSLLRWTTFYKTSPPWPGRLGWPHRHSLGSLSSTRLQSCDQIGLLSVIVFSVCLLSDALSQCLPSYLGFSYLGYGVSLQGCCSKAQLLPLTWWSSSPRLRLFTELLFSVSPC